MMAKKIAFRIRFLSILVDIWGQVGVENRPKIDPKRHRKNDGKKKSEKIGLMTKSGQPPRSGGQVPGPWGGIKGGVVRWKGI